MNTSEQEPTLNGDMTIAAYEALWKNLPPCPFAVGDRVTFSDEYKDSPLRHGGWMYVQVLLCKRNLPHLTISEVRDIYIYFKEVQDLIDSDGYSFKAGGFSYVPFKLINT
jgi:hypothetical protein